jgi:hypothetical protein
MLLLVPAPALPHRLDEYLQATLISVAKDRLQAEMTLTPGVAVFPVVASAIDAGAEGAAPQSRERAYAARVLRDLSLTMDGRPLMPRLVSVQFPGADEMKEGLGGIRIVFQAALPRGGRRRRLTFENRHQNRLAAYLVNCLVPADPGITIVAQTRNESQSFYQLDYVQAGALPFARWSGERAWFGVLALLLLTRFAYLCRGRLTEQKRCVIAEKIAPQEPVVRPRDLLV